MTPAPKPILLDKSEVEGAWSGVSEFISRALARQTKWSLEDIRMQCITGNMQLWVFPRKAALVTQIHTYPLERVCVLLLCGGDGLDGAEHWVGVIEDWARLHWGVRALEIYGRRGWGRALGYEAVETVLRKQL